MSTVCASALLWCLVDLDVLDNEVASVEALGIGVGLGVLEETEKELGRLNWPAGAGDTELLAYGPISARRSIIPIIPSVSRTLGGATGSTSISSHRNGLLVLLNVLEELHGTLELPAIDSLCGLAGVLEGNTEVSTAGASRLRRVDFGGSVTDL